MEMTSKVAEASKAAAGAAMAAAQEVGKEVSRAAAEMGGTRLEKFQSAWRQIDYLLREEDEGGEDSPGGAGGQTVSAQRCDALRDMLQRINDLLRDEWEDIDRMSLIEAGDAPPCLEYLIKNVGGKGKLDLLCTYCEESSPREFRTIITGGLAVMFDTVQHPLFWGSQAVQSPLKRLLQASSSRLTRLPEQGTDLIRLLGSVSNHLRNFENELLPFFFDPAYSPEGERADESFLAFSILLQFIHDECEEEEVQRALLSCVRLQDPAVLRWIAHKSSFAADLGLGLRTLYRQALLPADDAEGGGCFFSSASHRFFRLLEFCNAVASTTRSEELQSVLGRQIRNHLGQAIAASLLRESDQAVQATCFARAVVNSIAKHEVLVITGEGGRPGGNGGDKEDFYTSPRDRGASGGGASPKAATGQVPIDDPDFFNKPLFETHRAVQQPVVETFVAAAAGCASPSLLPQSTCTQPRGEPTPPHPLLRM